MTAINTSSGSQVFVFMQLGARRREQIILNEPKVTGNS
jgi:hypothetical protein